MSSIRPLCASSAARYTSVIPVSFYYPNEIEWQVMLATLDETDQLAVGLFGRGHDQPVATRHLKDCNLDALQRAMQSIREQAADTDAANWRDRSNDPLVIHRRLREERADQRPILCFLKPDNQGGMMSTRVTINDTAAEINRTHYEMKKKAVTGYNEGYGAKEYSRFVLNMVRDPDTIFPLADRHVLAAYRVTPKASTRLNWGHASLGF